MKNVMGWRLKRLRQCAKCPWKVGVDPHDIPDAYSEEGHRALANTIAVPGQFILGATEMHVMSCHEHNSDEGVYCIGWLMNQLGPGNNIALRMKMRDCENAKGIALDGEQHETFEDTLP